MGKQRRRLKTDSVLTVYQKKKFVAENPHWDMKPVDIHKIIKTFHENAVEAAITNQHGTVLPFKFGHIYLMNTGKRKKFAIDPAASKAAGRKVYFKNWETDNNSLRIVFTTSTHRGYIRFSNVLGFKACKKFRKKASDYFLKNWHRCLTVKVQILMHLK